MPRQLDSWACSSRSIQTLTHEPSETGGCIDLLRVGSCEVDNVHTMILSWVAHSMAIHGARAESLFGGWHLRQLKRILAPSILS